MFSRKIVAAATLSAAALFLGPVAVASAAGSPATTGLGAGSADAGSSSGSAGSSSGSAGSSSGSAMLDSGSSALDGGTHAIVNILDAINGVSNLGKSKPAS
ncbi:hypothetical protein ACFXG4_44360 [Nocardia sp. NPDC059246]|uniref:hypothetical protein n=1 Tax=unclassified Nocardia TaxID=2637762 RepID=UPI003683D0C5